MASYTSTQLRARIRDRSTLPRSEPNSSDLGTKRASDSDDEVRDVLQEGVIAGGEEEETR